MYRRLLLLLFTMLPASAQGQCGIFACGSFTANTPAELESILSQTNTWIRLDFANQPDQIFGPFVWGSDFYEEFLITNPIDYYFADARVDLPGRTGPWNRSRLARPTRVYENYRITMFPYLGPDINSYILDNLPHGSNSYTVLFLPEVAFRTPEPGALVLFLLAVGMAGLTRLRRPDTTNCRTQCGVGTG
jgi:hypothetical protein